ncbi:hypothetical protein CLOSYM_02383 [[Clostridium] symbiosum ATCC 14940]|uniref:Uncharacterized protein n=1 Tax=[Clostridium] symbiosum ATCC 14940 TaxID=411472 RepID=A0ABC9TXL5_CLOSY|nr:hypothetical protein CLOSYM_02383 [[Clostridium] symbiosum ATCC 14940]
MWEIRYAFNTPFIKNCGGYDIGLPETRSGRDRAIPLTTPDMVRSGRVLLPQLNLQFVFKAR